jgi:hypothetical protein
MAALVTQEEAFRQLRLTATTTSTEEMADVMFKAEQASAIVVDYLKRPWPEVTPLEAGRPSPYAPTQSPVGPMAEPPYAPIPWTEVSCPVLVKGVILVILTALYDGRSPQDELLSGPVVAVLERYRDPALA